MPDFGSPVAQNVKGPDLGMLSDMMSLKQKQQALTSGAIGIQQQQQKLTGTGANEAQGAQQTMQERQSVTQMMKSGVDDKGNNIRDANGEPDITKILPALGRMAPMTGQQYAQSIIQTHSAKVGLQGASLSLDSQQKSALMAPLQAIATNPDDPTLIKAASDTIDQWGAAHPEMAPAVASAKMLFTHVQNAKTPEERAHMASSLSALFQPGQQVQTQPQGATVTNGQTTQVGTTAPPVAGGGFTPTTSVEQKLPPGTPVMRGGTPGYLGGDPKVASGPALGQAAGVEGPVATNNAHYAGIQQAAQGATAHIGVLDNISSLAHGAATGDNAAWKKVVTGFAGWLGISTDKATATDVMAKEVALAAKGAGRTDLENLMNQSATPGGKMTEDAIRITAAQLIGRDKAALAAQQFFAKTPTNSPLYTEKMGQWAKSGDPQAFEFAAKSPEDQAKLKAELVKTGKWSGLASKMRALHGMGIEP